MATNKNTSYRYRIIDNCLKNTARKWTLNDLIGTISEKLEEDFGIYKGVGKRTVQDDIRIMRSMPPMGFDAPIICTDGHYSYDDPNYSINNSPLNEKDINKLKEAISLFRQFESIPLFEELSGMMLKIEGKLHTDSANNRKIIDFEKVENAKGTIFIKPLYKSIKDKQVVEVNYRPFGSNENLPMLIHPYLLKEYNNRWFLIGFNDKLEKMSHLALDRILSISESGIAFKKSGQFNESLYFNNILGITLPENAKTETIQLHFTPNRAPYIKTKPIHPSQKTITEDETGLYIQLELIINPELISHLLSFGKDIHILKPDNLRSEIHAILSESLKKNK